MIRSADEVVLLAGPDKFPGTGMARVCGPDAIDVLVCREGTDPATLEAFVAAETRVVTT
jgi:DeoR/GlpR family transcriptional regulator of sugar metabolism